MRSFVGTIVEGLMDDTEIEWDNLELIWAQRYTEEFAQFISKYPGTAS